MAYQKANLKRLANAKKRIATYKRRKATLLEKAAQLSKLCKVPLCLLVYGSTSEETDDEVVSVPEIWPSDETKVRDIIRLYKDTMSSNSCMKETHVETFVNDLGKAKEMESTDHHKRVLPKNKNVDKYSSWEQELDMCSREQLQRIFFNVDNKLHEAVTRQERFMYRDTPIPQSLIMDQNYMQQYFSEQPHELQSFPINNYNNMGFSFISPHDDDQIQMDPNLMENQINFGLMQRQAQPYNYNCQVPVVHERSAAYNGNPFAGYQIPFNSP